MPITKIPVVNKFGIISENQRLEITERLYRKALLNSCLGQQSFLAQRNPLEVTEEFVKQYNDATSEAEQKKYKTLASKMLARIKRRVGLNSFGVGKHVNIPVAWKELSQLLECTGTIQDECLNCLLLSLGQAPIHQNQVASLFFLAETLLYLLMTESLQLAFLQSAEIKTLKVCQLLFTRLYFHKMANHLQGCHCFKNRLSDYLQGLSESQSLYSSYPDVHLSLRYMLQVASIILTNVELNVGEMKNGDNLSALPQEKNNDHPEKLEIPSMSSKESYNTGETRCSSSHNSWMSSSIHDLSPALWHALDVWKCQNLLISKSSEKIKRESSFISSLLSLIQCSSSPDNGSSWIDCMVAVMILAEGAKMNIITLKILQNMACHCINRAHKSEIKTPTRATGYDECLQKNSKNLPTKKLQTSPLSVLKPEEEGNEQVSGDELPKGDCLSIPTGGNTIKTDSSQTQMSSSSNVSSDAMACNSYVPMESSFHRWHWGMALTYATLLADIVLFAKTSSIQKRALLGMNKDIANESFLSQPHQCCENFYNEEAINDEGFGCCVGLFDLTFFQSSCSVPVNADEANNWSWRVRFGAIQGLIRICKSLSKDSTRRALQTAVWGILYQANATERDPRVREALRVGYVQLHLDVSLNLQAFPFPSSLASHLANGLVKIYLSDPNCKPPGEKILIQGGARNKEVRQEMKKKMAEEKSFKKHRTSLREEILFRSAWRVTPMDYNTRTTFHLQRLVEEQWRKNLVREVVNGKNSSEGEENREKIFSCRDQTESLVTDQVLPLRFQNQKQGEDFSTK